MNNHAKHLILLIAAALLSLAAQPQSFAGSATWQANPTSGDWTTVANWTPNTVPNGPVDIANFSTSSVRDVFVTGLIEVASLTFESNAGAFTISAVPALNLGTVLSVSGAGINNASGQVQTFATEFNDTFSSGIYFENNATAGEMTSFVGAGGVFVFLDSSSADSGSFEVSDGSAPGEISFSDNSTAANSTILASNSASVYFFDSATAASAKITATSDSDLVFGTSSTAGHAVVTLSAAGHTGFSQSATADHGHFTANGAETSSDLGASILLGDDSSAGEATFIVNGGTASHAPGAAMFIVGGATAANANITLNGGSGGGGGGALVFQGKSFGGTATISVFDNGELDISDLMAPGVTIGSLAGDGRVLLGTRTLTVGSNNQSTSFSGVIQENGSLAKIGTGTLTLSGANTYTGATTVSGGVLKALNRNGSATGTGAVNVNAGTLGGQGTITGPTTIGTGSGAGAFLQSGVGASKPTTLSIQGLLTLKSDSTYTYKLNTNKAKADQVVANGVTIQSGAQFSFNAVANKRLQQGLLFTAISNTSAAPISGSFANLPDGSVLTVGRNKFEVSYSGGDGNDLTLTVVR